MHSKRIHSLIFLVILFYVAYIGHQDRDYFQKTSQLQHIFDTEAFESVSVQHCVGISSTECVVRHTGV